MNDNTAQQRKKPVLNPLQPGVAAAIAEATLRPLWDKMEAEQELHPEIGAVMKDGTIYAGISPDTKQPMFAAPADAPLTMNFNKAAEYASTLDAHGHQDWRLPTKSELNVLFQNLEKGALKDTFNLTGPYTNDWYWSSPIDDAYAWCQRFSDGQQFDNDRNAHISVRCIRS